MYTPRPKADPSLGLTDDDFPVEVTEVWPDCWPAVSFFEEIGPGAWSIGAKGAIGIRPEACREIRLALGVTAAQWREIYPDLRILEDAALDAIKAATP